MKKRAKIITTIASLCLAVALMAFGVYAAANATLGITSSVKFLATDVKVTWTYSVVGNGIEDLSGEVTFNEEGASGELTTGDVESRTLQLGTSAAPLQFARAAGDTITYKFTVHNDGLNSVRVTPSGTTYFAAAANGNMTVVYYADDVETITLSNDNKLTGNWAAESPAYVDVAADGYYTFAVVLTLVNATQDVAQQNAAFQFSAVRTPA